MRYRILGFNPDLPSNLPGNIIDSSQVLPTLAGIGSGITVGGVVATSFTGPPLGSASIALAPNGKRIIIGTSTRLYEPNTLFGSMVEIGSGYTASLTPWSITNFGNVLLAINKQNVLQRSTGFLGAFAPVAGAPKAEIVITPGEPNAQTVMCCNYVDGATEVQDGIWHSALADYTSWTPGEDVLTGPGQRQLIDVAGAITAAIPYRDGALIFKRQAMYWATRGQITAWRITRISDSVGCCGKYAVTTADDAIYFADESGLWVFDGSFPRPMPGGLHSWWVNNAVSGEHSPVRLTYDRARHLLWVAYSPGLYLAYNTHSQQWTNFGTIDNAAGNATVAELISSPNGAFYAVTASGLYSLSATPRAGYVRFAAHGNTYGVVRISSVRPVFIAGPADATPAWLTGTLHYGATLRNVATAGDAMTPGILPGTLDCNREARYLATRLDFAAGVPWEMSEMALVVQENPNGEYASAG